MGDLNCLLVITGALICRIGYELQNLLVRRRAGTGILRHELKQDIRLNIKIVLRDIFFDILLKRIRRNAATFKRQEKLFFGHKGLSAICTPGLFNAFEKVIRFEVVDGVVVNKKRQWTLIGHQVFRVFDCVFNLIRRHFH